MGPSSVIIDVHSHPILKFGRGAPMGAGQMPSWSVQSAIEFMDTHGVSACVLSAPDLANGEPGQRGRDLARRANETLAEIVAEHPTRFGALATLPGLDPDGACNEIAHALDTLGLDGVATSTSIGGAYLGEPQFHPWLDELDGRAATLFIHPTITEAAQPLLMGLHPSILEFMFDTTRMIVNLIVTGTKRRFAAIKMVSTHAGGTIPFLVRRIGTLEHTFGVGPGRIELSPEEVRAGAASFYYDLTAATSKPQLAGLLDLVPVSQLLMGLDFPFMPASSFAPAIADLDSYGFSEDDLEAIRAENAGRLFPALHQRLSALVDRI
jgi:predicted TIM-barrel fold metal-dependent hydrolase